MLAGAGTIGAAVLQSNEAEKPVDVVRRFARPLSGDAADLQPVMDLAATASYVLIGEASHGTHEFYATRASITRELINQRGFNAVLIEGDWPDAYRVNRFVRSESQDETAEQALASFDKYPLWMWGNTDARDFVVWLRESNKVRGENAVRTGFYGMDLYSPFRSRDAVLSWLRAVDPAEAERADERYRELGRYGETPEAYGTAVGYRGAQSAARAVEEAFEQVRRIAEPLLNLEDRAVADAAFDAEQNARLVRNAEEYYREMYRGATNTWNLRDRHMADTLDALSEYLTRRDGYARIAVWAHNSHLGDARASDSARRGEWNLGQLVRERHPGEAILVGFTTHAGTVIASTNWDEDGVVKRVRPSLPGSYERLFHDSGIAAFVLPIREEAVTKGLARPLLQRAIGVIYRPDTERYSHYFEAKLSEQFDVVIHFDETRAVEPITSTHARAA